MNYYDELIGNIDSLIKNNEIDKARELIDEELKQAYIPKDTLEKLNDFLYEIGPKVTFNKNFSDDDIIAYLNDSKEKQLIAVELLNKKNLRDYIELCNDYLSNEDRFLNAKVLLIDSLVNQEIGDEISYKNDGMEYTFIPKYVIPILESDGFISGKKHLEDIYLKEPSKLKMAIDLLYKDLMLSLPINLDEIEGIKLADDIVEYINQAFM